MTDDPTPEVRRRLLAEFTDAEVVADLARRLALFDDIKADAKTTFAARDWDAVLPAGGFLTGFLSAEKGGGVPLTEAASGSGGPDADLSGMCVAYIGNFEPPHSTENEYRKAWEANGVGVFCVQENDRNAWATVIYELRSPRRSFDLIMWTRTVWPDMNFDGMRHMQEVARERGVPVVGVHLDIWHGLAREDEIGQHPWFRSDVLFTADGGHGYDWEADGIDHVWLPPGVSEFECGPAEPDPRFAADVAFVGGWQGYHPESGHRHELVSWLGKRPCRFFPPKGQHAIRGADLRRLYATTKVNVGDSCFAGSGLPRYWSDRIPETLGRGGFLLHPHVPGIEDHYTDGEHLRLWQAGDWDELDKLITYYLDHEDERRRIAEQGRAHVLETATYTVRVREIVATLRERGML